MLKKQVRFFMPRIPQMRDFFAFVPVVHLEFFFDVTDYQFIYLIP